MAQSKQVMADYVGRHTRNETCHVYGIGEGALAWRSCPFSDTDATVTVNDGGRLSDPDYLVVVDPATRFAKERWRHIRGSRAGAVFCQLPWDQLPIDNNMRLVRIGISQQRRCALASPRELDRGTTSVYVALQVAYWMGFGQVTISGAGLAGHALGADAAVRARVLGEVGEMARIMQSRGVLVWSVSPGSALSDYVPHRDARAL